MPSQLLGGVLVAAGLLALVLPEEAPPSPESFEKMPQVPGD
jgi:hypothetical protein